MVVAHLSGFMPQGRIGVGFAALRDLEVSPAADAVNLMLGPDEPDSDSTRAFELLSFLPASAGDARLNVGKTILATTQPLRPDRQARTCCPLP